MSTVNENHIYDLLVVGGGINGAGIAADAAGRKLSVVLCEQFDLANETSSRSSKMIHGGLRYLEYYEFRLVREALSERDTMLSIAPHIVSPLQIILPHKPNQRPRWLIKLGLFLYDHLGFHFGKKSRIPKSYGLKLHNDSLYATPLKTNLTHGFCYYDCKVDDARLVILNAMAARQHDATILPRTKFLGAKKQNNIWLSTLQDQHTKKQWQVKSKALVNAAGPWVDDVIHNKLQIDTKNKVELVQGSHIVVPKFYPGDHAYLLQHTDKRVIFVIPYHDNFTMIGTTDVSYNGDPALATINQHEREYLCNVVNQYFEQSISPEDIVNEWSGVRPLQHDDANNPSAVSRDYSLEIKDDNGNTPILSVFGGKITTYRELAEHAMRKLKPFFPQMGSAWTATTSLPGGDINSANEYSQQLQEQYPFLPASMLQRYAHSYGSLSQTILHSVSCTDDMGQNFGAELYQKEIDYLTQHEWAQTVEDILWRRSKLGLLAINQDKLEGYLAKNIDTK